MHKTPANPQEEVAHELILEELGVAHGLHHEALQGNDTTRSSCKLAGEGTAGTHQQKKYQGLQYAQTARHPRPLHPQQNTKQYA